MQRTGELDAFVHGDPAAPRVLVLVHGRDMTAADLAPFADSLRLANTYIVVPEAPDPSPRGGRTWWAMDGGDKRVVGVDLAAQTFPGREPARARFADFLQTFAGRDLAVAGFSQGGMLAMDALLLSPQPPPIRALALLSSSRIDIGAWTPTEGRLRDLPVLVAHGRSDAELAFAAGEGLRDFATAAGARVTWLPFDGTHEIPLVVWRGLKRFLSTP